MKFILDLASSLSIPRIGLQLFHYAGPVITLVSLGLIWEISTIAFRIPRYLLPAPSQVVGELWEWRDTLVLHVTVTASETLVGFVSAVLVGVPLAALIVLSRVLHSTIYPLLVVTQSIPKIAVTPLLMVWLGFGIHPKMLVAFLVCFFPIVVDTATGLKLAHPDLLDLMRSLSASEWQILVKIRFPSALPQIFGGLKVAITLATIGAVIAEFVGGDAGLGYLVVLGVQHLNTALSFGAIVLLAILSMVLFYAVVWLEHKLVPWTGHQAGF